MTSRAKQSIWWVMAAVAWFVAIAGYLHTLDVLREHHAARLDLRRDIAMLADLEGRLLRAEATQSKIAAAARQHAGEGVQGVLQVLPDGMLPASQDVTQVALDEAWWIRRVRLGFQRVPLIDIQQFIHEVEMRPAPWRAVSLSITEGDEGEARANVELTLESLVPAERGHGS